MVKIFINDQNVTWYEPSERGIGMVFQSYALYPQMSVEGNLSFSLKNAKLSKEEINDRVKNASEILQIEDLLIESQLHSLEVSAKGLPLEEHWLEMSRFFCLMSLYLILMQS